MRHIRAANARSSGPITSGMLPDGEAVAVGFERLVQPPCATSTSPTFSCEIDRSVPFERSGRKMQRPSGGLEVA
jgi:hypothetical protein